MPHSIAELTFVRKIDKIVYKIVDLICTSCDQVRSPMVNRGFWEE